MCGLMALYIILFTCGFDFAAPYTLYSTMSIQLPIVPGTEGNNVAPPEMLKPEGENEITEEDAVIEEGDILEENLDGEGGGIADEDSDTEGDTNVDENNTNKDPDGIDVKNVINYDKMIENRKVMMFIGIAGLATFSLFTFIGMVGGR